MGVETVLEQWRSRKDFPRRFTAEKIFPARPGDYRPYPEWVPEKLVQVLTDRGIERLYSHQREAVDHVGEGRNVVVVTPTASGKTLCYNLPVLASLLRQPETRALYLFPTKALSQDQYKEFHSLIGDLDLPAAVYTYDGDTPAAARQAIRKQGHVVITNPDMLHTGILPHHTKWAKFFRNLKYVVIDELHTYRGVFGSHMANLFRRLKRIAKFYNSSIQFICCSATIANPMELASSLCEEPMELVDGNGAPSPEKHFFFYNPPVINRELGIRKSALSSARHLVAPFLKQGIQSLIFATSRLNVEVLTRTLKERFETGLPGQERIRGYRGGYLPETRREIEQGLREGRLIGVVSTNALELGIDIGNLDVCILAGYPGSVASTYQQAGRAGRRKGCSTAILVARSNPLDQFIITHPDYFFGASPEYGRIHPDNLLILLSHIQCAAFELPFEEGETFGGEDLGEILKYLEEEGILHRSGERYHWMRDAYPADGVSLRSIPEQNFVVTDRTDRANPVTLAEVDYSSAPITLHEGAIYLCESKTYIVEKLDFANRQAFVKRAEVDYYTDAVTYTQVRALDRFESERSGVCEKGHGEVFVTRKVTGFKKIRFFTSENLGYGEVNLPDLDLHTTAYWFTIPHEVLAGLPYEAGTLIDGILGIAHALHHVAVLHLMCDVRDLDRSVGDRQGSWSARPARGVVRHETSEEGAPPSSFDPTLFLYDAYPGGVGFSARLYDLHARLLDETESMIRTCDCREGCPSCVGPVNEVGVLSKETALVILKEIRP
jgi:DEAD/DEAH box helicase domain-containing protein